MERLVYIQPFKRQFHLICHLLVLLGAHHILHVSRVRVKVNLPFSFQKFS